MSSVTVSIFIVTTRASDFVKWKRHASPLSLLSRWSIACCLPFPPSHARVIEQLRVTPLAEKIVRGEIKKGCKVKIGFAGSGILFTLD
jgi:hypothetical protein